MTSYNNRSNNTPNNGEEIIETETDSTYVERTSVLPQATEYHRVNREQIIRPAPNYQPITPTPPPPPPNDASASSSQNQYGQSITAQDTEDKPWYKSWQTWIMALIGIIAAILITWSLTSSSDQEKESLQTGEENAIIVELKTEISDLKTELSQNQTNLENAQKALTAIQANLDAANTKISSLETENAELTTSANNAKNSLTQVESELESTKSALENNQTALTQANEDIKKANEENAKLVKLLQENNITIP